jgi:hypothetical protein
MGATVETRSARAWRRVGQSILAGAVYDAALAAAILVFDDAASRWLGIPLPDNRVYFHLNGIFLLLLAALYLLAARQPQRHGGIVALAAAGRFAGFLFLGAAWLGGQPPAFAGLALGDLAFALAHATLLAAARRARD